MANVHFSHNRDDWETPQELFDSLNSKYHFNVDVAANESNHKCDTYYTKEQDGLSAQWPKNSRCWCNPPYGREIAKWVRKASEEAENGVTTVMLIPARTDTNWFHDYIYCQPGVAVQFIRHRIRFVGAEHNAPFPSMVVIFVGRR